MSQHPNLDSFLIVRFETAMMSLMAGMGMPR